MISPTPDAAEILIVEDNKPVLESMSKALDEAGYAVSQAPSGQEAFEFLRNRLFDLVLLDLKLPDVDGMDILRTIRRQDDEVPVIIVSSVNQLDTKVGGFDIGCDDYITKPFQVPELIGRVRRLLRRAETGLYPAATRSGRKPVQSRIEAGPFTLDIPTFQVTKNGTPLKMRKKLFDLLLYFVRNPDIVVSPEVLHQHVWDPREEINMNSVYVHIHQLRSIIEDTPSKPLHLKTIRGVGFTFSARVAANQSARPAP